MRTILHVDMDAFYASVEQRDDPALRGKPVIVGGPSRRGVVLAASYEVRPFGVHSAMPMAEALRRAPKAIVVAPKHDRYAQVSDGAFAIFRRYTPLVQALSLDEAFLDVTASRALFGDGESIARAIKAAVSRELGVTASAGVAPCKFAAKVASDLKKPDGLVVVPTGGVAEFLAPLPIERMWGVGPKTAPRLRSRGFATIGDLARASADELRRELGSWGDHVARLARGEDDRDVDPEALAKSVGAEQTYEEDLVGVDAVARTLLTHCGRVARRLIRSGLEARSVAVKVKYADFAARTRRMTLPESVQDTDSIHRAALLLIARMPLDKRRVRLTGVSVSGLAPVPAEPNLFPDHQVEKGRRLEAVTAQIAERYGSDAAVTRASLLRRKDERKDPVKD
jgi:DNA polymerase IV